MFKNIKSSVHLALAFKNYRNDDLVKAKYHAQENLRIARKKSATALAFYATILVIERNLTSARSHFLESIKALNGKDKDDAQYISLYCKYYVCLIDEGSECDTIRLEALSMVVSDSIKSWLPLPDKAVPI